MRILLLLILTSFNCLSQQTYKTKSGVVYSVGDTLNIGQPLSHLGWISIYTDKDKKEDYILNKNLINRDVLITKIDTTYKKARVEFLYKKKLFIVDIDEALRNKEVIPQFQRALGKKGSSNKYESLLILKELLDSNVLTKEEFDIEKKRVLSSD